MAQPRASATAPAAAAAATAAKGTAATGTATGVAALAGSGGFAVAVAAILSAFVSFLARLREQHRGWLSRELGRYSSQPDDIRLVLEQEMALEQEFARNSANRVATALPELLRIPDRDERERRIRQLFADEERFAAQRAEAMAARAIAALGRFELRRTSPLGAFWRLGAAQKHTEGCKFMAGWPLRDGRFWPWAVLDRVHPPRHYGCTAGLHSYGEAVLNGWMTPSDVPDTRSAIRAASRVLMEGESDALLRELDVRDRLAERGVDTSLIGWLGIKAGGEGGAAEAV